MNEAITYEIIQAAIDAGVSEFILCSGSRNSSFIFALKDQPNLKVYFAFEERSAAFFALGRCKLLNKPAAIVVSSGSAVGELLPAAMEAHYTGMPLMLITADRPHRFRGSGAPQSVEQEGIFGFYVRKEYDLGPNDLCDLSDWDQKGPVQINVRLEEPQKQPPIQYKELKITPFIAKKAIIPGDKPLKEFLSKVRRPLAIVSALKSEDKEAVVNFLQALQIPVVLEGTSGIREEPRLQHLRIMRAEKILDAATAAGYPIDGVLRIGGIPTQRLWRDLEYLEGKVEVCSISDVPFSGLSWNRHIICTSIADFLTAHHKNFESAENWLEEDRRYYQMVVRLFETEPLSEPAILNQLSKIIPKYSNIYLGNSLPIREWDLAASYENRGFNVYASRGVCGIDGQLSTFLGMCEPDCSNWAILGDLTSLYDLVGPWMLSQMEKMKFNIVIVNNGGGKFFERLYPGQTEMLNIHELNFAPLAQLWGVDYERYERIPTEINMSGIVEIIPDDAATKRFWDAIGQGVKNEKIESAHR